MFKKFTVKKTKYYNILQNRRDENDVIATVDIGMCGSEDLELLQPEIESLLTSGVLASFRVTLKKFNMKNLGIDPNRPECCMFCLRTYNK